MNITVGVQTCLAATRGRHAYLCSGVVTRERQVPEKMLVHRAKPAISQEPDSAALIHAHCLVYRSY